MVISRSLKAHRADPVISKTHQSAFRFNARDSHSRFTRQAFYFSQENFGLFIRRESFFPRRQLVPKLGNYGQFGLLFASHALLVLQIFNLRPLSAPCFNLIQTLLCFKQSSPRQRFDTANHWQQTRGTTEPIRIGFGRRIFHGFNLRNCKPICVGRIIECFQLGQQLFRRTTSRVKDKFGKAVRNKVVKAFSYSVGRRRCPIVPLQSGLGTIIL